MKFFKINWNKLYTLCLLGYDFIPHFIKVSRKISIDLLELKPSDKVLIVGAGTGLDLEFLSNHCEIVATDINPSMVERIKKRNRTLKRNVQAMVMDGQSLDFPDNTFDVIILHLILAVITDPAKCIQEAERVLKPGGKITIYDKFISQDVKNSFFRRTANLLSNKFIYNLTYDFKFILCHSDLTLLSDEDADFNGLFRLIRLTKGFIY